MSKKFVIYTFILILVAGISALGGSVAGGIAVYNYLNENTSNPVILEPTPVFASQTTNQTINVDVDTAITQAVEKVGPAVVTVVGVVPGQTTFFFGRTADSSVSGSGVIISTDGYIITNNHVIEGTSDVSIIFADGTDRSAEIIGADEFSDIAILKVDGSIPAVATFGNSDSLKPGESVIAIGSPLGDYKNTVTAGVVSATERMLDVSANYQMEGLIQTDAAINQGNSGGPLVNLAGEVVGINNIIVRGGSFSGAVAEGLGFAIPSNKAKAVATQLIDKGYISYPYMGIRWQWITPRIASINNLPVDGGVYISYVEPGSPAGEAGLQEGDIITKIGNQVLDEEHPYINVLYSYSPGETTDLEVVRGGEPINLTITFGEPPQP
jgi:S1-C subfamily serine protease